MDSPCKRQGRWSAGGGSTIIQKQLRFTSILKHLLVCSYLGHCNIATPVELNLITSTVNWIVRREIGVGKNWYIKEQGKFTGWKMLFPNYYLDFSTTTLSSCNGFNLWSVVCFLLTSASRLNAHLCWKTGINQPV